MINETQCIVVNPTTNVFAFRIPTVCRPVAKVDRLLDALQNYSAVNCFKNSIIKVILYLKDQNFRILYYWKNIDESKYI